MMPCYSPLIFGTDAGEKFITAESVYAVFDSKQKIDKETVEYTNRKIERVVNLHRDIAWNDCRRSGVPPQSPAAHSRRNSGRGIRWLEHSGVLCGGQSEH